MKKKNSIKVKSQAIDEKEQYQLDLNDQLNVALNDLDVDYARKLLNAGADPTAKDSKVLYTLSKLKEWYGDEYSTLFISLFEDFGYSLSASKSAHHLWNSTSTDSGDIMINRTKAEREDLDEFEFAQVKSAAILGLWGASMTDSPLFTRVPSRSAKVFEKTAQDMQKEGEVPPKVMSWEKLARAFGADKVNECRESIQFGMKARLASKELNIPFVMAADLVDDWEKVGGKVLSEAVGVVKKEGQTLNLFDNPDYQKSQEKEQQEIQEYRNPEVDVSSYKIIADLSGDDTLYFYLVSKGDSIEDKKVVDAIGVPHFINSEWKPAEYTGYSYELPVRLGDINLSVFEDSYDPEGIQFINKVDDFFPVEVEWNIDSYEDLEFLILNHNFVTISSKFPEALVEKVREVLASTVPKIAIDQAAEEYYKMYWGPYGDQLVKEVKKRVKADLAKIWLKKQGVDEAAAEYWSNYYTDKNYGELMTATPKDRKP